VIFHTLLVLIKIKASLYEGFNNFAENHTDDQTHRIFKIDE
jgi:hypothetical protein